MINALSYYLGTGTGGLAAATVGGFIAAAVFQDALYFIVPGVGLLLDMARTEKPAVVLMDRETWEKQQEHGDDNQ